MHRALSILPCSLLAVVLAAGCKSTPAPAPAAEPVAATSAATFPARPSAKPAAFKLFHYYEHSFTLTVSEKATDDEIAALVWELRDAAQQHSFDKLKLKQADVDSGSNNWFHIYRGAKCASEKYGEGKLPCGGAYHASGDYTFSKVNGKPWDKGVLLHDEKETLLWAPGSAYAPAN